MKSFLFVFLLTSILGMSQSTTPQVALSRIQASPRHVEPAYHIAVARTDQIQYGYSGNFPRDLYGVLDTRMAGQSCNIGPCIWGYADSDDCPIVFDAPAGYSVVIVSIEGNVTFGIKSMPGTTPPDPWSWSGILGALYLPSMVGGAGCNECASGVPVYVEDVLAVTGGNHSTPFHFHGALALAADNTIVARLASYLNNTTWPIHMEITYTFAFQIVPQGGSQDSSLFRLPEAKGFYEVNTQGIALDPSLFRVLYEVNPQKP